MTENDLYNVIHEMYHKPKPFEFYTASELWTDKHTSKQMLKFHLDENIDLSSRNKKFIEKSIEWINDRFKINSKTQIADFGCGPGLYAIEFAELGAKVTGIDFSENSINYAREKARERGLSINYHIEDYLNFNTEEKYDLIIMIFCDFCALSAEQRRILLTKFHSYLKPDGFILLDVYSLNFFDQKKEIAICEKNQLNGFWSPNDYYGFLNTFKYEDEKISLDKYTIIEKSRKRVIYNWLHYYSRDSIIKELAENGFNTIEIHSDVSGTEFNPVSKEIAVVAKPY